MALIAYTRFRFLWGAVDLDTGPDTPTYTSANSVGDLGAGDYGMRAQLVFDRSASGEDDMTTHLDFVNFTGGAVDSSWTDGDFTALEGYLHTFLLTLMAHVHSAISTREIRWYPFGQGVAVPNPAVRVTPDVVAGAQGGVYLPPQSAVTATYRTGLRRQWGRGYFPWESSLDVAGYGRPSDALCDSLAGGVDALVQSAAADDFVLVVWSPTHARAFAVESVTVDNVPDVIRRRRPAAATYRKTLPAA